MRIAHHHIGREFTPFVIAEMSGNHNQSLDRALAIVEAAAGCGVQAIKLQTYTADTLTLDINEGDFFINDPDSLWQGKSLYSLYKEAFTPWEWHAPIMEKARELGLVCFSTPFDETAVDFLETLNVPAYKIASFENNHLPLIRKVASTGKPILLSTGMATLAELDEAITAARGAGCHDIILLKCTSTYPATPESSNVATIPHMRDLFRCEIGISDHTMGIGVSVAAVALGATVIEKHFTLNRADGGVDSSFSLEPEEMKSLAEEACRAWISLGKISYGATEAEKRSSVFRRSLYIAENIKAGEILTKANLRAIRPGLGIPVKYMDMLLGKHVNRNLQRGQPMQWEFLG